MLYTGPWHDAIVQLGAAQRVAVKQRIVRETAEAEIGADVTGLAAHSSQSGSNETSDSDWIAVCASDEIRAVLVAEAVYARRGRSSGPATIVKVALWVEPQWRRRGMAQALLQRCIAVNRQAGVRHLAFDGLDNDEALRKLLRRFSADLVFAGKTCQAWLELGSITAPVATPVLAV
jgi:GNAT superfamily N-acetyltransferase